MESRSAKALFIVLILLGVGINCYDAANSLLKMESGFDPSNLKLLAFQNERDEIPRLSFLRKECNHLTLDSRNSIVPIFAGLPAILVHACGKAGHAAFSGVSSGGGNLLSATPVFAAPSGWTLGIGIAQSSGECTSGDEIIALSSGASVILKPGTGYVYCLTAPGATNFTTFSITWSQ
jgi:hypothetical protein